MSNSVRVSASLLSANFLKLGDEIMATENAGVHSFHLDVMDNHLAPNLSYGPPVIQWIRKATQLPLEVHLMIDNPHLFVEDYAKAGADLLFFHVESYGKEPINPLQIREVPRSTHDVDLAAILKTIDQIKQLGVKAGITINPNTPLIDDLWPAIEASDAVLIMSVNPGFSGQKFLESVLPKITQIQSRAPMDVHIDGGITDQTAPQAKAAGATTLISASYLFGSADYIDAVARLI